MSGDGLATVLKVKNRELDRAREQHQDAQRVVNDAKADLQKHEEASQRPLVAARANIDDVVLADRAHTRILALLETAKDVVAKAEEAHQSSRKRLVSAMNVASSIAAIVDERAQEAQREADKRADRAVDEIAMARFGRGGSK